MDVPMQLPTAPAATMLLLGLLTALAVRQGAMRYAPWGAATVWPRSAAAVGLGLVLLLWGAFVYDGLKFRDGNILLKAGMVRLFSGMVDTETRAILEEAQRVYPFDPRIQEHLTVVYANDPALSLPESINKLEAMLPNDPWAPNHLINLAGKYLQLAEALAAQGNQAGAIQAVERTNELFIKLQRVAGFSHYTWGIGGMLFLIQGRSAEAAALFKRALTINPDYPPAAQGLATAEQRLQGQAIPPAAEP
jgi:tetratricopeptide (TPR) repeat protein